MKNNRGQALVIFVVLLPIILLIFMFLLDLGRVYVENRKVSNTVKDTIEYILDHKKDPNIKLKATELINSNVKNIESLDIRINNKVEITLKKNVEKFIYKDYEIKVSYEGYLKNNKKIIIRK